LQKSRVKTILIKTNKIKFSNMANRINSKEVKKYIQNYILKSIDSEGYSITTNTDEEKIKFLTNTFVNEYCYKENLTRYSNRYDLIFIEWLKGLPSSINIVFYNSDIINFFKECKLIDENTTEKRIDYLLENYWKIICISYFDLKIKYNVKF